MSIPTALVDKLARAIYEDSPEVDGTWEENIIPFDSKGAYAASTRARAAARAALRLFEVRVDREQGRYQSLGVIRGHDLGNHFVRYESHFGDDPDWEPDVTRVRYTLITNWEDEE